MPRRWAPGSGLNAIVALLPAPDWLALPTPGGEDRDESPLLPSREAHHVTEGEGKEEDTVGPGSEGPWAPSSATGRTFSKKAG